MRNVNYWVMFKVLTGLPFLVLALFLSGCGGAKDDNMALKVGVMAGPEMDVMKVAVEILRRDKDIDVELVEFSDYVLPNIALSDGSIDVNAIQHRPYLNSFIQSRGIKLAVVGKAFLYPMGAYSKRISDLDSLRKGAKVAIPNDPNNEGRALILLHNRGLIILKDASNLQATPLDIVENPRSLKFIELDAAQLPRSLDDVDLAFINSTYAVPAGLLPDHDALMIEGRNSAYVNILVSREDNKNDPRVQALVKSYQTEAVEMVAARLFKGGAVAGWK
ncbi:MAG: MetQ/NlpA family ABC transporter substrate-binding protein [Candidatus Endonucleobacter sp. (ex Gigantidas childressi)]|nr:MetQ/NlpA family ABC transporter substrate-binding protein [Candidatus Endonucleobacter sp. (ex Gigantidas childressi)]